MTGKTTGEMIGEINPLTNDINSFAFLKKIFENKKILITGHTGFKGSWLCMMLHRMGAEVYGFALEAPTQPSLFKIANIENLLTSHIGDIRNYTQICDFMQQVQPEFVIHMAAQALVKASYEDPLETYAVNVMGTANVLEAVRHTSSVSVVLNVTTDKTYENKEWCWGYRENDALGGHDPYSNSKACSELVTASYRKSFFTPQNFGDKHQVVIASARAGNVIGGGDWASYRLIPDFLRAIASSEQVKIRNPHAIRPWQHVLEPLTGYLSLCAQMYTKGLPFGEAWNFGPRDSDAKEVGWIVKYLCSLWGDQASYAIDQGEHPHEANYLKLDCSKAHTLLHWQPKWNISQALAAVVDWTKAYHRGEDMQVFSFRQIDGYTKLN